MLGINMTKDYLTSTLLVQYALKIAENAGLPVMELLAHAELDPADVFDPDGLIPSSKDRRLMAEIVRQTGNEYFWVREIDAAAVAQNNPCWYYYMNAKTVREGEKRSSRIYRLLSQGAYPHHIEQGDEFIVRNAFHSPKYVANKYLLDWGLSGWWGTLKYFTGPAIRLKAVRLKANDEGRKNAYEAFYQVPVFINQPHDELVLPRTALDLPNGNTEPDTNLDFLLDRLIQPALEAATDSKATLFKEEIFKVFQTELVHGKPSVQGIAKHMGMSSRSFQRKLAENGTTFSGLLGDVRKELAGSYLKEPDLNVTDVALLLGFQESSSFTVAFRQWYDSTPIEYRRQYRGQ